MVVVLIVGNSAHPAQEITQKLIDNCDKVIACDGAIERCLQHLIRVDYVIGDMDSLKDMTIEELEEFDFEIHKIDDQNNNDLSKAITFAQNLGAKRIEIIGVEGGSNQHQFAAFWSLLECKVEAYIHLEDSIISFVNCNSVKFPIEIGKPFSIFAIGQCFGVSITGSKWNMTDEIISPNSRGLHNIAMDEEIEIMCKEGTLLIFRSR